MQADEKEHGISVEEAWAAHMKARHRAAVIDAWLDTLTPGLTLIGIVLVGAFVLGLVAYVTDQTIAQDRCANLCDSASVILCEKDSAICRGDAGVVERLVHPRSEP